MCFIFNNLKTISTVTCTFSEVKSIITIELLQQKDLYLSSTEEKVQKIFNKSRYKTSQMVRSEDRGTNLHI